MLLLVLGVTGSAMAGNGREQDSRVFDGATQAAAGPLSSPWGCPLEMKDSPCTAIFHPADDLPSCLSVQVSIADCGATPTASAEGCLPSLRQLVLGEVEVLNEEGNLISLWELRYIDGSVVVVLIDID